MGEHVFRAQGLEAAAAARAAANSGSSRIGLVRAARCAPSAPARIASPLLRRPAVAGGVRAGLTTAPHAPQLQRVERSGRPELQCSDAVIVAGVARTAHDRALAAKFAELCRGQPELACLPALLAGRQPPGPSPPVIQARPPGSPGRATAAPRAPRGRPCQRAPRASGGVRGAGEARLAGAPVLGARVGACAAGPRARLTAAAAQVRPARKMALLHHTLHRGGAARPVSLFAGAPGRSKRPRFDNVLIGCAPRPARLPPRASAACRARAARALVAARRCPGTHSCRVAQLRFLFEREAGSERGRFAFVRLYESIGMDPTRDRLGMMRVRFAEGAGGDGGEGVYDVARLEDVMRPVLLQPDAETPDQLDAPEAWFFNHFVS